MNVIYFMTGEGGPPEIGFAEYPEDGDAVEDMLGESKLSNVTIHEFDYDEKSKRYAYAGNFGVSHPQFPDMSPKEEPVPARAPQGEAGRKEAP